MMMQARVPKEPEGVQANEDEKRDQVNGMQNQEELCHIRNPVSYIDNSLIVPKPLSAFFPLGLEQEVVALAIGSLEEQKEENIVQQILEQAEL